MFLYIDPGTGSMLFTILIGVFGAAVYFFRGLFLKLKFVFSRGKVDKNIKEKTPFVIFSDHKRYWNIFEPICDEFEKRETPVTYMTASEDDPALDKEYKYVTTTFIGEGNRAFAKLNMLNARIVLSTTPSLDVFQWKRSKDVEYYVHIPHMANDINLYKMFGLDYYDSILISGDFMEEQIRELEEKRGLPKKEIHMVGIPYMDVMRKRIENEGRKSDKADGKKRPVVLLAPSWGESSILNRFGEKFIDALVATGYEIVVRPHPQSFSSETEMIDRLMKKYPDGETVSWNRDNDNFDILNKADIMISDFSGVMFDFALVYDKPVIYTDAEFDVSPYDAWWSDKGLWTHSVLPKFGVKLDADNVDNIKSVIDDVLSGEDFAKGRDIARQECWQYMGHGAERTVDYLIEKNRQLSEKNADSKKDSKEKSNDKQLPEGNSDNDQLSGDSSDKEEVKA